MIIVTVRGIRISTVYTCMLVSCIARYACRRVFRRFCPRNIIITTLYTYNITVLSRVVKIIINILCTSRC